MRRKFEAFILSSAFFYMHKLSTAVTKEGISRVHLGKENGVLDDNIKVTIVDADDEGNPIFRQWTPSASDIEGPENVDVAEDSKPTFRINEGEEINGVNDGNPLLFSDGGYNFGKANSENDYIDMKRKLTYSKKCHKNARVKAVVETVIVCDKEFGDLFNHDYQKILNYWVVTMWDVNMRYKSLPSNDISFQVNDILVINNTNAQPFIENARNSKGETSTGRMSPLFSNWVYEQREKLPLHDVIALVSNSTIDCPDLTHFCAAGQALVSSPCSELDHEEKKSLQTLVWYDGDVWKNVVTAAHELGHSLGAHHDHETMNCSDRGFIMDYGRTDKLQYFFSSCSDKQISEFVRSDQASCLRTLSSNKPKLDPSFDYPKAPSIAEECKRISKNPDAEFKPLKEGEDICKDVVCWCQPQTNANQSKAYFSPVDNSECSSDGGRCFRGVCRQPGHFFKNVGSGLCIQISNPFNPDALFLMVECPSPGTPLDKVFVKQGKEGSMLASPFQKGTEVGERCGYAGNAEGDTIKTNRCDDNNQQQGWDFQNTGNNQIFLKHRATGKCAKPERNSVGSHIGTYKVCNSMDNNMKWQRYF